MISIKSKTEIELMKKAGEITARTFGLVEEMIKPGITTGMIDTAVNKFILSQGGTPSFKNYNGFPKSICASVNEEVVHGIPGNRKIEDGDIISIDIGVCYKGYQSDCARTYPVGTISDEAKRLIKVTEECFFRGIEKAVEGAHLSDVSAAIQTWAEENGYSVVRDLTGHGIGRNLHEDPEIPNFGKPGHGPRLRAGMTLAVEPMINMGTYKVNILDNDWTVVTRDNKLSAHYENTILITKTKPIILTML